MGAWQRSGGGVSDRAARWPWVLSGALALGVLAVARVLSPDPTGLGTHEQLGLPPCLFHALTSWPCPACGLTTAFAHMARFDLPAAAAAHLFGAPSFIATVAVVPVCFAGAVRGWPFAATWRAFGLRRALPWVALAFLVAWIVRVAVLVLGE